MTAITKGLKKPSFMVDKKAHWDAPWCEVFTNMFGGTKTSVVKYYANDCTQAGARFMVKAVSPATGASGDLGDEYCANVFKGDLVTVLGEPATDDQKREWLHLRSMAKEIAW